MPKILEEDKIPLSDIEIAEMLSTHSDWSYDQKKKTLHRQYRFVHFRAAMAFVNEAALLFEKYNHHAELNLNYNALSIDITSHDVQSLTARDQRMLVFLDKIPYRRA